MFPGDGFMHAAVHALDWGATALGPVDAWCAELRAAVSICLDSQFQIAIAWGPDLVYVYNDAAIPIFGAKHPWALGRPVAEVWPEAWETVGPMLHSVLDTGRATRSDDLLLLLERNGFVEECYFTFSYSPIRRADGSTGGVFVTVLETSDRVLAARRQRALGDLTAAGALGDPDEPFGRLGDAFAAHCADLPLASLWLADQHGVLQPVFWSSRGGLRRPPAPALARLRTCAEQALFAGSPQVLAAAALLGDIDGMAAEVPRELLCLPLPPTAPPGVLLLAANPRQPLDNSHHAFLDGVAGCVGHAAIVVGARAAERRRVEAMAELDNVLEATSDAFVSVDRELRVLTLNAAAVPPGGERASLVGHALADLVPGLAGSVLEQALVAAAHGRHPPMVEHLDAHNGRWFSVRCYPSPQGAVLFGSDITSRKRAEHAAGACGAGTPGRGTYHRAARRTPPAGSGVRPRARRHCDLRAGRQDRPRQRRLCRADRVSGRRAAVSSGAHAGADGIARFSESTFAVVATRDDVGQLGAAAREVLRVMEQPFVHEQEELHLDPRVGIAVFPNDTLQFDELVRAAEAALRRAADAVERHFEFSRPELNRGASERFKLESALRRAIEREEFVLHYQPQVALDTGAIIGFEALVRWQHPERGLLAPGHFIALAEETGLILPIGEWVLRRACEQCRSWQDRGLDAVPVSVNLSARQFSEQIPETVRRILDETGLDPKLLELELTESASMESPEKTFEILRQLKAMGIGLAIDDFGTGYSNLNYLKRFPVDKLKLDQSFVRDIVSDPDDLSISRAVIAMAHGRRLTVIAEGVEGASQLTLLAEHGCDEIQGYLFSRPVEPEACARMLAEHASLPLDVLLRAR